MDTPATNDTGMVMCNRELVRDYLAAYVCDILGDILQIVGQASVDIATHAMTMLANQLIPVKQLIPVDAYGIYESAVIAYCNQTCNMTQEEYDSWMENMLDTVRSLDVYMDVVFSDDDDADVDTPVYLYRAALPKLFAAYLAGTTNTTVAQWTYRMHDARDGVKLLYFGPGSYVAAKEYIDYNIDVFMDDTALTDKEYRLIWKETVKHYCRMHDLYTDHWYDFCEDLHECIMNAE